MTSIMMFSVGHYNQPTIWDTIQTLSLHHKLNLFIIFFNIKVAPRAKGQVQFWFQCTQGSLIYHISLQLLFLNINLECSQQILLKVLHSISMQLNLVNCFMSYTIVPH
jgi:hypothetical protein